MVHRIVPEPTCAAGSFDFTLLSVGKDEGLRNGRMYAKAQGQRRSFIEAAQYGHIYGMCMD
jgi:hypothetical protein